MSFRGQIQERIPKVIYRLSFQSANEHTLGLIKAVLLNLGYSKEDLISASVKGKPAIELFNEQDDKLERVKKLFGRLKFSGVKVSISKLLPKDWLTLWKDQWKPAPLTKKMDVLPVLYQDKYKPRSVCDHI